MNISWTNNCTTRQPFGPLLCMLPVLGLLFPATSVQACLIVYGTVRLSGTLTTECVEVYGRIIIENGGTLILTGGPGSGSIVDGSIILEDASAELRFTNNHTVSGSGAIEGQDSGAKITIAASRTLTSETNITGHLEITGSGSFLNQGKVYADCPSGTLKISAASVDDSDNGGTVSSTNFRWGVNADEAKLLFSVEPSALEGDFYVHNGTLQAGLDSEGGDDIDVCTTGNILFDGGGITTGVDDSFRFSGICP